MGKGGAAAAHFLMSRIKFLKGKYDQPPQCVIAESLRNIDCKLQPAEDDGGMGNVKILLNPLDFHQVQVKEKLYSEIVKEIGALDGDSNYREVVDKVSKGIILATLAETGMKTADFLIKGYNQGPAVLTKLGDRISGNDRKQLDLKKKLVVELAIEVREAAERIQLELENKHVSP